MVNDVVAAVLYAGPVPLDMIWAAVAVPVLDLEAPAAVCNPFKKTPIVPRAEGSDHNPGFVSVYDLKVIRIYNGKDVCCEHV